MSQDREVIIKITFKHNPQMPEITDLEMDKAVLSIEHNFNAIGPRRIHVHAINREKQC